MLDTLLRRALLATASLACLLVASCGEPPAGARPAQAAGPGSGYAYKCVAELGSRADAAVPVLVERLRSGDLASVNFVIRGLAAFGPRAKSAVPGLLAVLERGRMVAGPVAEALGRIGDSSPPVIARLESLAKDADPEAAGAARAALALLSKR